MITEYETEQRIESLEVSAGILVVEDDPLVAAYISNVLIESGFHITGTAASGPEALGIVSEDTALALVDISLKGPMDGVEVARRLHDTYNIRAIFLSGALEPDVIERGNKVNPHGFLSKPFLPSQVCKALDKALAELHRPIL